MSSEKTTAAKRRYRKRRRAELEDETRLRITEAAVDLHGSLGPAKTTISAVAERAGVQRATVYRHFPDEEALFGACSMHWLGQHPLPDLAEWAAAGDPEERLRIALGDLYAWYESGEEMLEKTTRDASLVPAMRVPRELRIAWLAEAAATIVRGRPERGARRRRVEAAVGHAISFGTWRSLVREQGLSAPDAVDLMRGLVAVAAEG
ncbi:MAG TPA: helix-turn-helix domain-containing protein [Solirubrobacterales bacterium]|nr:helix-turn-helix domain-containing protein [Solirubrobacterales bacterium]